MNSISKECVLLSFKILICHHCVASNIRDIILIIRDECAIGANSSLKLFIQVTHLFDMNNY